MQWQDIGIVLTVERLQDNLLIVAVITKEHGFYKGVVRKRSSFKGFLDFSVGSFVVCRWQARLNEQLGMFQMEEIDTEFNKNNILIMSLTSCMPYNSINKLSIQDQGSYLGLYMLTSIIDLLVSLMPERQQCPKLFHKIKHFITSANKTFNNSQQLIDILRQYWLLEKDILEFLGTHICLRFCHICGSANNLIFFDVQHARLCCKDHSPKQKIVLLELNILEKIVQWLQINGQLFCKYFEWKEKTLPFQRALLLKHIKQLKLLDE